MRNTAFISAFLSLFIALPTAWAKTNAVPYTQDTAQQYESCTQLVRQQPEQTFKKARAWYQETKALAAQHCMALALYEMRDFLGAAHELENILHSVTPSQGRLWLSMKSQTAKAYQNAGRFANADQHLGQALRWASDNGLDDDMVPLLVQRGRIYALHNEHLRAIHDLDHALSIDEKNDLVLLERARVFIKMGDTDSALKDIKSVLANDPLHEEASILLGKVERRQTDQRARAQ